jgi:hypothetical protein
MSLKDRFAYAFGMSQDMLLESRVRLNLDSHDQRLREMRLAWDAYYGADSQGLNKWGLPVEKLLLVAEGEADPNVELNFARLIVNKGASFLFGQDVTFDIDAARKTPQEKYLDGFWRQNKKMSLLQRMAISGGVAGHPALKIVPARNGQAYLGLRVINPSMLTVFFNPDDFEDVQEYRIEWNYQDVVAGKVVAKFRRQRHVPSDDGRSWDIVDEEGTQAAGPWVTMQQVKWPYPFSAVLDCQNLPDALEYYGSPDLAPDIIRIINRLNFIVSDWNQILRLHAGPREWGTGFSADEVKLSRDQMLIINNPDAKMGVLESLSDMVSTGSLYEKVKEALHEIARIPEVSVGKVDNIGTLSGVALEILYQPIIEMTTSKRETYGPVLEEICRRVLWISGKGRNVEVRTQWPPLLPSDPKLERDVANIDLNVLKIVSRETVAGELGRDWSVEEARIANDEVADLALQDKENQVNGTGKYAPKPAPGGGSSAGQQPGRSGAAKTNK